MNDIDLTVVLPCINEDENLRILLPQINRSLKSLNLSYEVIVVDSHQKNPTTEKICIENSARYINREHNNDYGNAVRTAQKNAVGKWILFMDADGSHNPNQIELLLNQRHNYQLVIGSRYVFGGKTENPLILIILSYIVNVIFRFVIRINVKDVSISFRLYRGDDFRKLNLVCNNFDIIEEILSKLTVYYPNYKILEVPVTFEKRKFGKTKRKLFLFALSYCYTILRLIILRQRAKEEIKRKNLALR